MNYKEFKANLGSAHREDLMRLLYTQERKLLQEEQTIIQMQGTLQQIRFYTLPGWQEDFKVAKDALYHISKEVVEALGE